MQGLGLGRWVPPGYPVAYDDLNLYALTLACSAGPSNCSSHMAPAPPQRIMHVPPRDAF